MDFDRIQTLLSRFSVPPDHQPNVFKVDHAGAATGLLSDSPSSSPTLFADRHMTEDMGQLMGRLFC